MLLLYNIVIVMFEPLKLCLLLWTLAQIYTKIINEILEHH